MVYARGAEYDIADEGNLLVQTTELVGEFNWFEVCWHIRVMALGSGKQPHGRRVPVADNEGFQVDKSKNASVSPSSVRRLMATR